MAEMKKKEQIDEIVLICWMHGELTVKVHVHAEIMHRVDGWAYRHGNFRPKIRAVEVLKLPEVGLEPK